jgi:hypothetical protein
VEGDDAEVELVDLDVGEAGVAHELGEGGGVGEAGDDYEQVSAGVLLAGEERGEVPWQAAFRPEAQMPVAIDSY